VVFGGSVATVLTPKPGQKQRVEPRVRLTVAGSSPGQQRHLCVPQIVQKSRTKRVFKQSWRAKIKSLFSTIRAGFHNLPAWFEILMKDCDLIITKRSPKLQTSLFAR